MSTLQDECQSYMSAPALGPQKTMISPTRSHLCWPLDPPTESGLLPRGPSTTQEISLGFPALIQQSGRHVRPFLVPRGFLWQQHKWERKMVTMTVLRFQKKAKNYWHHGEHLTIRTCSVGSSWPCDDRFLLKHVQMTEQSFSFKISCPAWRHSCLFVTLRVFFPGHPY